MARIKWKERALKAEATLEKCKNFFDAYNAPSGVCKNCGEYLHPYYCCAHCGQDPSDPSRNVKER